MSKSKFGVVCTVLVVSAFFHTPSLEAQLDMPARTVEVAGSAGFSSGVGAVDRFTSITKLVADVSTLTGGTVTFDPGSNTKWNLGVSGGYAIKSNLMAVGEVVRTRLANPIFRLSVP